MTPKEYLSRVPLVRSETERLAAYWRGFSEKDWTTPTFCPGWAAQDAVAHITTGADFYANSVRRAVEGLPPEPPYGGDAKEFYAIRKERGDALMAGPRAAMVDAFESSGRLVVEALEMAGEGDLAKLGWHPRGLTPVDAWIGLRLVELVVHDWDIRLGQDKSARPTAPGVEGMLTFLPATQCRHFNVREKPGFHGRYLFCTTRPDRGWSMAVEGERASFRPDAMGPHDATVTADAEALLFLNYGRLAREDAERGGRLRVDGNRELADKLLGVLFAKY
ncbi:MAG: maleylpyruvate isomerase family mycothiol-dependent enzyme [Candidatus Tectomicrobia bacterium]|uniref:Maleylpyruvate isomerase family mycothiol-dependent enzyme n=1 Tax=Tectimicrobiota bacterium TaxID=2528274 RepID=A0A932MNM3_UNCTE|nr:maleylpyruvate isomerase family mycothiol-dependent enzyme [Candidatus Tectomicrobia bacterium]